MDIKLNDQKEDITIWPKKLYTQYEVDDLLEKKEKNLSSRMEKIEENQTATHKQIPGNKTVANLVKQSNRILVSISSHAFPIDIFPDAINVEEGRITIINRHLFSSEVHSVDIKDISNIFINTDIFFSQLVIISKTFEENETKIRNLWTREAVFVRRIIEGLRIFEHNQIDTSGYTKDELVSKLRELSTTKIVM